MSTRLQIQLERQRAVYDNMPRPLLSQLAEIHGISIREFAAMFGISKKFANDIFLHRTYPPLDLAIRMARYWECSVEELFGWRVDDDGMRRPLIVELPGTGKALRLNNANREHDALSLIRLMCEAVAGVKSLIDYPALWRRPHQPPRKKREEG